MNAKKLATVIICSTSLLLSACDAENQAEVAHLNTVDLAADSPKHVDQETLVHAEDSDDQDNEGEIDIEVDEDSDIEDFEVEDSEVQEFEDEEEAEDLEPGNAQDDDEETGYSSYAATPQHSTLNASKRVGKGHRSTLNAKIYRNGSIRADFKSTNSHNTRGFTGAFSIFVYSQEGRLLAKTDRKQVGVNASGFRRRREASRHFNFDLSSQLPDGTIRSTDEVVAIIERVRTNRVWKWLSDSENLKKIRESLKELKKIVEVFTSNKSSSTPSSSSGGGGSFEPRLPSGNSGGWLPSGDGGRDRIML